MITRSLQSATIDINPFADSSYTLVDLETCRELRKLVGKDEDESDECP